MHYKEVFKFDLKNVRVKCADGYTCQGKCYAHSELGDDDELELYIDVNHVNIPVADIESIEEI